MSLGSQINSFCKDIAKSNLFWTMQFEDGSFLKWYNDDESEILPLWSTESRVKKAIKVEPEFKGATPVSITLEIFISEWLPDLDKNSIAIGPNWSGENLTGTSFEANELIDRIKNTK
jgi:hypothetical protein